MSKEGAVPTSPRNHRRLLALTGGTVVVVASLLLLASRGPVPNLALGTGDLLPSPLLSRLGVGARPQRNPLLIIIADPDCSHCHAVIDEALDLWTPRVAQANSLIIAFSRRSAGARPTDLGPRADRATVLVDSSGSILKELRIRNFPQLLTVDESGRIVSIVSGAMPEDSLQRIISGAPFHEK
jgi:Thioredoxin-like domain